MPYTKPSQSMRCSAIAKFYLNFPISSFTRSNQFLKFQETQEENHTQNKDDENSLDK
jgi:hypothetical protein